jgi:NADH-quinone oxidoreductase subunit H
MLVSVAAMGAAGFLGGWWGPVLPGAVWMILKSLVLLGFLIAAGHLVPRIPIERFVVTAWVVLIPLALVNIFVSGAILL